MNRRAKKDRRSYSKKISVEQRRLKRRKEDISNARSYYLVLTISLLILAFIGVISYMYGR
jgi:hypothetical protein